MNSYERIFAIMKGEPVDRTPVTAVLSMYGARLTGCNLEDYYTKAENYVKGQAAVIEKFEPDFILSPFCVANEAKAFGCEIKYFKTNPPNITKRAISSYHDIKSLKIPDINTNPYLTYTREAVRMLSKQYHGQIPLGAIWMDPLDMLACAIGLESFMELMIFHKTEFDEALDGISDFCESFGNALLQDGADILVDFGSICGVAIITRAMAENIAKPVLEKVYSNMKGGILFHHGGYKIAPYIDIYKNLPNLLGFIIDTKDKLQVARENAGDDLIIAGNIEGPSLDIRTPELISIICSKMLSTMEKDKHYLLCTSDADVPYATDEKQIQAFMQAPRIFNGN